MSDAQGDLFSGGGFSAQKDPSGGSDHLPVAWETIEDDGLIAALPDADLSDSLAITAEIGRRKLVEAIPALEHLCRRFSGFGARDLVPEQAAVLDALARIGGSEAAQAVTRLIVRGAVQGPGMQVAVRTAADFGAILPPGAVLGLLRADDPETRASACRCVGPRPSPLTIATLIDLLDDLHPSVREAAACALGRAGRRESRARLVARLRRETSAEVIEAIAPIADDECIILLGRLAHADATLRDVALDALDAIDHPRAQTVAARVRSTAPKG